MGFDPYSAAAKYMLLALLAAAVLGAVARWRYLEGEVDDLRADKAALEEQFQLQQKNAALASLIAGKAAEKERSRNTSLGKGKTEIANAKVPVPAVCRPALAPLGVAADWVRRSQAERAALEAAEPGVPE